ncbi:methyltransferase, FxLD system [Pseudonocardia hispaniensis]|uniref:Protein-L-isoaspartate O-methyltransferase n=1 Tax=Pseudonocardia hispaniensis TaxID=904933 RepID=A0ABW1J7K3_9PSEU
MVSPERARSRLVEELRRGSRVRSPAVADAFATVPRHLFLPGSTIETAYSDEAIATKFAGGVAISSASQPSMMAIMLEQLGLCPGQRVLEIGAGTGYNAALMARIVGPSGSVTAIDIDPELIAQAEDNLRAAAVKGVELVVGDGALGHPDGAPFDRIILTVGSWDVRPEWVEQLVPGGRLVLPLAVRGSQLSVAFDLGGDGALRSDSVRSCAFIRLRGIGAGPATRAASTGDGLLIQVAEDSTVDPAAVAAALQEPGPVRATGVPIGPADLWDGLGLWLALADRSTLRVLASGEAAESPLARRLLRIGPDRGTVALVDGEPGEDCALLVLDPRGRPGTGRLHPAAVQVFGPAGGPAAARLGRMVRRWHALGRLNAADLVIAAVLPSGEPPAVPAGRTVIDKEFSRLLLGWARPTQPT